MTALLARWTEKLAGGLQAGTSDSPPTSKSRGSRWTTTKTIIVSKMMFECGVLAWYQCECDNFEVIQNGFWKMAMGSRKGTEKTSER